MRRRDFIGIVGGAALWPLTARAQQRALPVIGYLSPSRPHPDLDFVAFRKGLGETGFADGRNVSFEYRWAEGEGRYDRLAAYAREFVDRKVAVIVAVAGAATVARQATATIPIVFRIGGDPVAGGVVASLSRPGGNVTGVTSLSSELTPKRFELLHEMVPAATSIAVLLNPTNRITEALRKNAENTAAVLGLRLVVLNASNALEIEAAFDTLAQQRLGALVVGNDPYFFDQSEQLIALAARHSIPASYFAREMVDAGGLMSYGASLADEFRLAGVYAGRILKGQKPADLPVMQSSRFEFVINMKTAKALGLTVPATLLVFANEVIE